MEQWRFEAMSKAEAGEQTRRTALRRVIGGGLTALLASAGLGSADDAAAARSRCRRSCEKDSAGNNRSRCLKRCRRRHRRGHTLRQEGTAELLRQSPETCSDLGTCRDFVFGEITGAPVKDGTFTGVMTGTNIRGDETSISVDFSGTLVAAERIGNHTIGATLALTMTQQRPAAGEPPTRSLPSPSRAPL